MRVTKRLEFFDVIIALAMAIILVATLYPFLFIVSVAFSDPFYVAQNKITFYPRGFTIEALRMISENQRVPRAYLNTIIYTLTGTSVNLFLTAISAYPLSRKKFFGRKVYLRLIVFTMLFSGGMIPSYIIVSKLGLLDSMWALVFPNAIWTFELLIMKSFYEGMPEELHEAGVIDGASELRMMFQIFIPLSKPALASIGLFYFMGHWNSFFIPMIYINSANKFPLQVILRDMLIENTVMRTTDVETGKMTPEILKNATIFVTMIPVLLVYPFAQKYFTKGVMIGSIKG